jgi:hypothetical protein
MLAQLAVDSGQNAGNQSEHWLNCNLAALMF